MGVFLGRAVRGVGKYTGGNGESTDQKLTVRNASNTVMDLRAALEKIDVVLRRRVQQRKEFTVQV